MEIKKVDGGWEYDGVVCTNKEDLIASIEADKEVPPTDSSDSPEQELEIIWEPSMGKDCLEYYIAQYLILPGKDLQSLRHEFADFIANLDAKKRA